MTWPATPLPVTVEIAPGAVVTAAPSSWTWQDITQYVRVDQGITITAGRGDEAGQVQPSTCALTLDNTGGRFSPRNPLSPYYPDLARGTPLRVSIQDDDVLDRFARTVSNGWGSADSGQAYTVVGTAADYSVGSGVGRHSHPSVNVLHHSHLDSGTPDFDLTAAVSCPVVATGASISARVGGRVTDTSNYYAARIAWGTAGTATVELVSVVGGSLTSLTSAVSLGAYSAGHWIQVRCQGIGSSLSAKAWNANTTAEPAGWMVTATDTNLTTGNRVILSSRVEAGNSNTLPVVLSWDNLQRPEIQRFSGYVSEWPPRWDLSGKDTTAPIRADGILRRLQQGTPLSLWPLRRAILGTTSPTLRAYWPCEDSADSLQAASAIVGQPPLAAGGGTPDWGQILYVYTPAHTGRPPFAPQVRLRGVSLSAQMTTIGSSTAWSVRWWQGVAVGGTATAVIELATPGGSYVKYRIGMDASNRFQVIGINAAGSATVLLQDVAVDAGMYLPYGLTAQQTGSDIALAADLAGTPLTATLTTKTLTAVTGVALNPDRLPVADPAYLNVGQVQVWDTINAPTFPSFVDDGGLRILPYNAWFGEAAHRRLIRLCAEDGVPLTVASVPEAFATRMQSQWDGTQLDLYRACEAADDGVLYENGFGLGYLPRGSRYNPPVRLALDYAAGHLTTMEPIDDDQRLLNHVRVTRSGGSSAIDENSASLNVEGTYADDVELQLSSDLQLPDQTSWRLHEGQVDELRWPSLVWDLARNPDLITAWQACQVGSRITVAHPPPEATYDDVDALLEGWTEVLGPFTWAVEAHTSPARVWEAFQVGHDRLGRVDTDGSTLASSATTTDTSLSVATTVATGRLWTTNAAAFPFDVNVAGERVRVTGISGTTSPQTFTVTRSVNGVVKAQTAGTAVSLWRPGCVPF